MPNFDFFEKPAFGSVPKSTCLDSCFSILSMPSNSWVLSQFSKSFQVSESLLCAGFINLTVVLMILIVMIDFISWITHFVSLMNDVEVFEYYPLQRRFSALSWSDKSIAVRNMSAFFFPIPGFASYRTTITIRLASSSHLSHPDTLSIWVRDGLVTLCWLSCLGIPVLPWHEWPHDLSFPA